MPGPRPRDVTIKRTGYYFARIRGMDRGVVFLTAGDTLPRALAMPGDRVVWVGI